jgi:hypothetical protein
MFTSNQRGALFVEDQDRRYFIEHVTHKMHERRGKEIAEWAQNEDMGPLRNYFENLSMGDFNPSGKAMETADRADVIDAGDSDIDHWARDLAADPDSFLKMGNSAYKPRDLYSLGELTSACKVARGAAASEKAVGNALRKAGVTPTKTRISTLRGRVTLWVVKNTDKWLSPSTDIREIAATYDSSLPEGAKGQKF